ncbi:hypothetical protein F5972_08585 [Microbispora cellulosiformans]|uniref:Uncharacterized protein n=1 Tax=Microbispora cellulosiformans TaxID=2614688 RepID=A0A5J5K5X9_9ACTN|nr:hypothetical protein [Microbispora cellulosiformans]KAA9379697.1 hypothetical protein F5972_08585 [Microbispora cellulosiformans]
MTAQDAQVVGDEEQLVGYVRARLAEQGDALEVAFDAACPGLPPGVTEDQARRRTWAALDAAKAGADLAVLRQVLAMYDGAAETRAALRRGGWKALSHTGAVEALVNVIRVHAQHRWGDRPDFAPFRRRWVDSLRVTAAALGGPAPGG